MTKQPVCTAPSIVCAYCHSAHLFSRRSQKLESSMAPLDAWMQHPTGYRFAANGAIELSSFWDLLLNKWALWQYAHTMLGAVQTGCFVMAGVGAFYLLTKRDEIYGRTFLRAGVLSGTVAAILKLFPTGDMQGKLVAYNQQPTLAAMEGLFESQEGAPLAILGQPDVEKRKLDNPLEVPEMLSVLTYRQWRANVKGLSDFPQTEWPDQIPLLYYSYHVMVGLGTIFIAVMVLASMLLWRGKLYDSGWMLWTLMVCVPLPYIANTAGWMTAELGQSSIRRCWQCTAAAHTPSASTASIQSHTVFLATAASKPEPSRR